MMPRQSRNSMLLLLQSQPLILKFWIRLMTIRPLNWKRKPLAFHLRFYAQMRKLLPSENKGPRHRQQSNKRWTWRDWQQGLDRLLLFLNHGKNGRGPGGED